MSGDPFKQACLGVLSQFDNLEKKKLKAAESWAEEASKERRIEYAHLEERRRIWD